MKYKFTIGNVLNVCLLILFLGIMMSACQKEHNKYYDFQNQKQEFAGSTFEYLQSQGGRYDSLLLVINRIDWIKRALEDTTFTLFAMPNQCFSTVIQNLNSLRASEQKESLYLNTVDSSQLDTLITRYIIPGQYPTDSIIFIDGRYFSSLKYGYQMQAQPIRVDASGLVNGGPSKLYFSDPKNSRYTRDWVRTTTQAVNIKTEDGIIQVLSGNHNFGFQEFVERMNH